MSRVIITGPTGGAPNRLEINDFIKNEKFFSLYIQALQVMQKEDQSLTLSSFQIGGIHGLPNVAWNGVRGISGWAWGGYCTHGSVLFPTWHRPYMMLYEQVMQQAAQKIAATYSVDPAGWKKAADDIRQPYWDWAVNSTPPNEVISLKQVTIVGPSGQKVTVDNPLYHYTFHPIDSSFRGRYGLWQTTLRQPTNSSGSATDNVSLLRNILHSGQSNITASTYNMLTRVTTWPAFSNHTVGDGGSRSNSLEGIHDNIHGMVGGIGHMGDPSVAAFDPIFYLHHCNVDRMLSLWAALHPGVWVSPNEAEDGTFTIPPRSHVDTTTSLTPFPNGQTTYWASAATTDTTKLGYSYPDFNGLDTGNQAAVKLAISKRVNQLYGTSVFGGFSAFAETAAAQVVSPTPQPPAAAAKQQPLAVQNPNPAPAARAAVPGVPATHPVPPPATDHPAPPPGSSHPGHGHGPQHSYHVGHDQPHHGPPNHGLYEWTARIECKKFELSSSYSVLIFLGQVPDDPKEWQVSPNLVGSHYAFVNSAAEECENCRNKADLVIEGFVHLNHGIVSHSGLHSLEPNVVAPYLTNNLHWRVLKVNGEPANLSSLEVTVHSTPLSYPPGAIFPVPGEPHQHDRITHGREGGSRHAPAGH